MSEADDMLRALLAIDEPPARDTAFSYAVMARIEQRRFWTEIAFLAPVALAVCVGLWALAPMLTDLTVRVIGPLAQGAALPVLAVVLTLAALTLAGRGPVRA